MIYPARGSWHVGIGCALYQKGELYLMEISWETISKPSSCYCEEWVVPGDGVSLN